MPKNIFYHKKSKCACSDTSRSWTSPKIIFYFSTKMSKIPAHLKIRVFASTRGRVVSEKGHVWGTAPPREWTSPKIIFDAKISTTLSI